MRRGNKKGIVGVVSEATPTTPATVTATSIRATIAQLRELPAEVFWSWPDPNISQRVVDALMPFAVIPQGSTDSPTKQSAVSTKSA